MNIISDIIKYIDNNKNKVISISSLADSLSFNKYYIMKKFKKKLGITIFDYINQIKIYDSLNYFNYNYSILKIAIMSNFNSLEYYSEIFKKVLGISPIKYKYFIERKYNKLSNIEIENIKEKVLYLYNLNKQAKSYIIVKKASEYPTKKLSIFNK